MSGKKQVTFTTHDLSQLCQSAWASRECIDVVREKERFDYSGCAQAEQIHHRGIISGVYRDKFTLRSCAQLHHFKQLMVPQLML